mmetsp:Transcript_12812/g.32444  ORF Transcript_12812/g.32444 Transcript_12812/m.32444 type:complete len:165 (-) Transcript_12812:283-777(-)
MSNAPDRYDVILLPEGVNKVECTQDILTKNTVVFKIEREDHTLGNLLRMQLLRDPRVFFAGYKAPHPLEYHILIRVQTRPDPSASAAAAGAFDDGDAAFREAMLTPGRAATPGRGGEGVKYPPEEALALALEDLKSEVSLIKERVKMAIDLYQGSRPSAYGQYR